MLFNKLFVNIEVTLSNCRYHIHVICAAHEQSLVLDSLAIFFQKIAFLTYDVGNQISQASFYSRQNIEICDYIIVVVGDDYGASRNVMVSQMHLSYLGAKAKNKPMITLIKTRDEEIQVSWQLQDFTRLVERQSNQIYYYNSSTDIAQLLSYANNEMLANHKVAASWMMKSDIDTDYSHSQNLVNENSTPFKRLSKNALHYSESTDKSASGSAQASNKTDNYGYDNYNHDINNHNTTINNVHDRNVNSHHATQNIEDTDNITMPISLSEAVTVKYTAQAYEGGNLSDVELSTALTWQQILVALANIPLAFSNYGLQNCFNHLIGDKAELEIKSLMPNVHAVSRYKISEQDFYRLQQLLVAANWIQIVTSTARTTQQLWKLTFYAKNLLETQKQLLP